MGVRLLTFALWMVMVAAWASGTDLRPISVIYSYHGLITQSAERVGEECYLDLRDASKLGWRMQVQGAEADIEAEGRRLKLPIRNTAGAEKIPLFEAAKQLGAITQWSSDGSRLLILGQIRLIELDEQKNVCIESTLPVESRLFRLENPDRLVIDLDGAVLPSHQVINLPGGWRASQFKPSIVRIVWDGLYQASNLPTARPSRSLRIPLTGLGVRTEKVTSLSAQGILSSRGGNRTESDPASAGGLAQNEEPPVTQTTPPQPAPPTLASGFSLLSESEQEAIFSVGLSGPMSVRPSAAYLDPTTIEVSFPNTKPAHEEAFATPESALLNKLDTRQEPNGSLVLILTLERPLAFEVGLEGLKLKIRLVKPKASDGRFAGKVIVVDAGHGGEDSGARWGDLLEKDLALSIARKLAKILAEHGASVVMTRGDDTRIPLKERSEIANRSKADIFVSVHINSNKVAASRSGNMTFFHAQDSVGQLLAACIQKEIGKLSGLPNLGTVSDTRIYSSGFAVLRYSTMPCILLELGFINHPADRERMVQADFQNKIAQAVTRGLKVFVGDGSVKAGS